MPTLNFVDLVSAFAGYVLIVLLDSPIANLIKIYSDKITIPLPKGLDAKKWNSLTGYDAAEGGGGAKFIGKLERLLFYIAILIHAPELIAAWIAFKLASKWETWNNMIKVPEKLTGVDQLEYLLARRRWGTKTYQRFLIGTILDFFAAIAGFALFYFLKQSGLIPGLLKMIH